MPEKNIVMSNGNKIPTIGLGTYKSKPGEIQEVIKYAISVGYRHIDCAMAYGNEADVGEVLKESFSSGLVKREDLFVTTKLWNTYHRRKRVREGCLESMKDLGLDYLDLYLVHWPYAFKEGTDKFPKDEAGNMITSDTDYLETWKGMEDCYDEGLVKSIGLSNFNSEQIQRVLDHARIKPVVLQVESHPHMNQTLLIAFCKERGIAVTAHSPLGSPQRSLIRSNDPVPMDNPLVKSIADKYGKTTAQILIRYQVQRNVIVIPKSSNKERIKSNLNVFDFSLTNEDMSVLNSFEQRRLAAYFDVGWIVNHPYYPYKLPF